MNDHHRFVTATLLGLSMGFSNLAHAAVCDADTDGDVDRLDLSLIIGARNKSANGPDDPRDVDGDGTITVRDARTCVRQCSSPRCTVVDPTSSPPAGGTERLDTPKVAPVQNAVKNVSKPSLKTPGQLSKDSQGGTIVTGTAWKVKRGDTLYAIGRAIYPGDARRQAQLRQDIVKLNPSVFANGANNMAVGIVLKLPDYTVAKSESPKVPEPAKVPVPVPATTTLKSTSQPAVSATVVKPESETPPKDISDPKTTVKPEPESQVKKEQSTVKTQSASPQIDVESNILVSLGYSSGGDKLEFEGGSLDPAGAGGHLRLGYEQIYQHNHGYRIMLGLQYARADDSEKTSLRDNYLQFAYQYRVNPFVYGAGVVLHEGATVKSDSTIEYDAAAGVFVYMDNLGSSELAGWGLSYTSLEIEEKGRSRSFDASRIELYYIWRF